MGSKKKLAARLEITRQFVEPEQQLISVRRQCQWRGVSRAGLDSQPGGESPENLALMRLWAEQYTRTPFDGVWRLTAWLQPQGYEGKAKGVRRVWRFLGLDALSPQPTLSRAAPAHRIYPDWLHDVVIARMDHGWSADITDIRLRQGFVDVVAIIDWYSRYVIAWEVSVTWDSSFCLAALERALRGTQPAIFTTDQGGQFTSQAFTSRLLADGIHIRMDGRGRAFDNMFVERLWRSVKYEEVYLKDDRDVQESSHGLGGYLEVYNHERLHQSLDYQPPVVVYRHGKAMAAATTCN
jgi:putative transposase